MDIDHISIRVYVSRKCIIKIVRNKIWRSKFWYLGVKKRLFTFCRHVSYINILGSYRTSIIASLHSFVRPSSPICFAFSWFFLVSTSLGYARIANLYLFVFPSVMSNLLFQLSLGSFQSLYLSSEPKILRLVKWSFIPMEMNMRWRMDTEQANTSHV